MLNDRAEAGHRQGPERVNIRKLSGARLEQAAREGRTLIISSGNVPLALLIPVTPDWLGRWVEAEINRYIDGSVSTAEGGPGAQGGSTPPDPVEDSVQAPAVGMLTPRQEVLPPNVTIGRDVVWQRAIGIRVDGDPAGDKARLMGVVTDTAAKVLVGPLTRNIASIDESDVYNAVLELVDELKAHTRQPESIIGIGLELGGHIHDGQIIRSFNVHWETFSLADRLNAVFGLPVVVENDANALAILERRFHGVKDNDLAVILVTYRGVGCGLIVDGHLYRGSRGMAGEIGHMPVGVHPSAHKPMGRASAISEIGGDFVLCRCGNPYCLESVATPHAIGEAQETKDADGGYEAAKRLMTTGQTRRNFQSAGQALGRGAAAVINLFNPSTIVFYGPHELFGGSREFHIDADLGRLTESYPYLAGVIEAISENQFSTGAFDCRFIVRRDADDQRARAAAACLINRLMPTSKVLETRPVTVRAPRSDISAQ